MEYGLVLVSEEQMAKMSKADLISCARSLYSTIDRNDRRIEELKAQVDMFKSMVMVHDSYRGILIELSVPKSFVQR